MSKSIVIFYIKKETGKFDRYQIVTNKTMDYMVVSIRNFNEQESNPRTAFIQTNEYVRDAILEKESLKFVKSATESVLENIKDISRELDRLVYSVDEFKDKVNEWKGDEVLDD